uniref:Putative secreted protein n=1 Tax=Amblyomma triste TaxID=251400 RepID=A0A023G049_AMBTT
MKFKLFCFSVIATLVITSECQTRRPPSPPRRPPSPPRFQAGPPQHTACPPTCHDRQKPGDPCGPGCSCGTGGPFNRPLRPLLCLPVKTG